ncbi:MAG TPA: hypothetical protein VMQ52_03185 [Candidatus Saccharimonadales bacterium]|jgi:hypothetical protein|nr:hypothetical protein [Candidatus Saccharimonadales bacterium]
MPKAKAVKKTNQFLAKKELIKFGIYLSILINITLIVTLCVVKYDWDNGNLNYLTGSLQLTTCMNYFDKIGYGTKNDSGKPVSIGNVTFVPTYLTPSQLNNTCMIYAEIGPLLYLTEANNSEATGYFDKLTNAYPPTGQTLTVPVSYNSVTKQPFQPF